MEEIWKPIPGYEGYYEISNTGKVRSLTRIIIDKNGRACNYTGKEISLTIRHDKYVQVGLSKNGIKKKFKVHRLVALVFIPNPNNLPCVNHKDENPSNNYADNLEWCTIEYNNNYGTHNEKIKQSMKNSKKVAMCNKETCQIIKIYNSLHEAHRDTNIAIESISRVANGKRGSAGGYFWQFIKDEI